MGYWMLMAFILFVCSSKANENSNCDKWTCEYGAECRNVSKNTQKCVCPKFQCSDAERTLPVCVTGGVTYSNLCDVKKEACKRQEFIGIDHLGKCGPQICTTKWDCLFGGECLRGECVCVKCRDVMDRRIYYQRNHGDFPGANRAWKRTSVCGSDGITYDSECHLNYHACKARRLTVIQRRGLCPQDKVRLHQRINSAPTLDVVQRSLVADGQANCSVLEFSQCVSMNHPRLKYMGRYAQIAGKTSANAPVYKLVRPGFIGYPNDTEVKRNAKPIFLSRVVSSRHPNGAWIIGSKIASGRGWLGTVSTALLPYNIRTVWKSYNNRVKPRKWLKEISLSVHCHVTIDAINECTQSYVINGPREPNWQPVEPWTPYYELRVSQQITHRAKHKSNRKITVELVAKRKTSRFVSYILRLSTDRPSCGLPFLVGLKNRRKHEKKCEGSIIIRKGKQKKLIKTKIPFKAPTYGCTDFSATVLSVHGHVYEDDALTKRICSTEM